MKKRCNFYIDDDNVDYLHERGINISQLTDKFLSVYVELLRMSEDELVARMGELKQEIAEKSTELKMLENRLIELANGVDG